MRICILYPSSVPRGGVYTHVTNVKQWLENFGHEVQVPHIEALKYFGRLHSYLFNILVAKDIPEIMRGFDIIHCMSGGGFSFSLFHRLSKLKTPFVTTYHGSWFRLDSTVRKYKGYAVKDVPTWLVIHPIDELVKLFSLHEADRILSVSEYVRKVLIDDYGIHEKKIDVCYNGTDTEFFKPKGEIIGELKSKPIVLYAGYLVAHKGVNFLLRAIPRILKEVKAKFIIAGSGRCRSIYEDMARRLGISHSVTFLGQVPYEKIPLIYRTCDIYVLPSLMESFGLTITEAMASGKPVVASNIGAIPEIVQHRKTGILVHPASIDQLASAIIELLSDPKLAKRYGREGRKIVEEKFTWKAVTERVLRTYKKTIQKG